MDHNKHRIDINDLPTPTSAIVDDAEALENPETAAAVKGGIRKGQTFGIGSVNLKEVSSSGGDPGI